MSEQIYNAGGLRFWSEDAIIELRAELSKANELLAFIDAAMPPANENCEEPGISFLEAARRELADRKHMMEEVEKSAADVIAASQPAQPVEVKVKPLVWDECDCAETLGLRYLLCDPPQSDNANGWYVLEETTNTAIQSDGSPEAAKSAAQADYEARIMAALDVQPLTVQDAARVLLDADVTELVEQAMSDAVDETDEGTWVDEDRGACVGSAALNNAWVAALRAITEGRA